MITIHNKNIALFTYKNAFIFRLAQFVLRLRSRFQVILWQSHDQIFVTVLLEAVIDDLDTAQTESEHDGKEQSIATLPHCFLQSAFKSPTDDALRISSGNCSYFLVLGTHPYMV